MDEPVVTSFNSDNPGAYGVLEIKDDYVVGLEEKPQKPKSTLVNCGLYLLDASIFTLLKKLDRSPRGEYELTAAIKLMIEKEKVKNYTVKTWIPLTYPWNILAANKYLLDKYGSKISKKAEKRTRAVIEEPGAIEAKGGIGPNCFIRKYFSIGKGCKV